MGEGGFDGKAKEEEVEVGGGGFSSGKTVMVLAIVAGCFAVLWPKIFVPMIFGEAPHPVKTDDDGELTLIIISYKIYCPTSLQNLDCKRGRVEGVVFVHCGLQEI